MPLRRLLCLPILYAELERGKSKRILGIIAAYCSFEYRSCYQRMLISYDPLIKATSWSAVRTMMNLPNVVGQLCLLDNHE
jgi:hypothetical protein